MTVYTDITGTELANILRKNYKTEIEMAAANYLIAMTSVCDTDEGFDRLAGGAVPKLTELVRLVSKKRRCSFMNKPERGYCSLRLRRNVKRSASRVDAAGKVRHEDVFAYPPGIPLVVKGEIISEDSQ